METGTSNCIEVTSFEQLGRERGIPASVFPMHRSMCEHKGKLTFMAHPETPTLALLICPDCDDCWHICLDGLTEDGLKSLARWAQGVING
jgi:hypothetical protein